MRKIIAFLANRELTQFKLVISAIILSLVYSCSESGPESVKPGEHKCEFCKMGIVNLNYNSQILTKKGRRYNFDSIECLFSYWNQNEDKVEKVWVKNYLNSQDWLEVENAKFLKAEKLPSPMAANLSSYRSLEDAEKNLTIYGGSILSREDVMHFIKTNWDKDLSQKSK